MVGAPMTIPGHQMTKRVLRLDCTRHDPETGEAGRYNPIELEFLEEKARDLDALKVGDVVEVAFSVNGREYTDRSGQQRIFTSIRPYRLTVVQPVQTVQPFQTVQQVQPSAPAAGGSPVYYPEQGAASNDGDVPF